MVMVASDGATLQADPAGRLWELVEWVPGDATLGPTPAQVVAAAESLARVHLAAASLSGAPPSVDQSPGIAHRRARARGLLVHSWSMRDESCSPPDIRPRLACAVSAFAAADGAVALARLASLPSRPLRLQPVLRDVWSDHVLFVGRDVSGIIDWHAAGVDTPALDVARLLGSWPDESRNGRSFLDAYASINDLGDEESALVPVLRDAGIVFGLDNWFRWTIDEHRTFRDRDYVLKRIDRLLAALPAALQRLAGAEGSSD
jgi:homoserine kinase type II